MRKQVGSIHLPCTQCGFALQRAPSTLRKTNGRAFCDQKCRDDYWRGRPQTKKRSDTGVRKSPYVEKPCAFCGRVVPRRESDSIRHERHFCSRACVGEWRRANPPSGRPRSNQPWLSKQGYLEITVGKEHPMANSIGNCAVHRLVMSEHVGRPLLPGETVHHRNGVRTDNRIENLELWASKHLKGQRVTDLLAWAEEIIRTYKPIQDRLFEPGGGVMPQGAMTEEEEEQKRVLTSKNVGTLASVPRPEEPKPRNAEKRRKARTRVKRLENRS